MTCFKAQGQFLHAVLNLCLECFMSRTTEDNGLKLLPFESRTVVFYYQVGILHACVFLVKCVTINSKFNNYIISILSFK